MKKYVKRTKTIITPKENSQYFDVEQVTYKHELTPFEKQWMKFQKNEKKKEKEKEKQKQQKKENDYSGVAILLVLLFVLVAVLFVYFELNGYPV